MSDGSVRGMLGVLIDLLKWLRIYRERDFWIQIAAVIAGVFLWMIILPGEKIAGAMAVIPILIFVDFTMTNIVWAVSRRPYSCVIGGSIGYGLYNFAVGVIVHRLTVAEIPRNILLGVIYGFVFTWFAFAIFYFLGLIKTGEKAKDQQS